MKAMILSSGRVQHILHFCLFTFIFCLAGAQTPQGFNYQAVARDATGTPVASASLQVRIGLLSDTTLNTVVWEEIHNPVVTSPQGVFSIVIGAGTRQAPSAVAEFTDIDWSSSHLFIRTAIYYQSDWREMGKAKLWSVPYAMTAGDLSGALKKLEVAGAATGMDEALFEVKNRNGHTVFAVYNEGVRIYVGDGSSKAVKGGFAIGTFDETKADTLNLMVVNKDSVRVYIYDDPLNKAVKGGFAIGGFDESKGITNDYMLISPDSIRMYIDKDGSKAVKGGFAIGGFDESKIPGQEFLRITNDSIRMYVSDDPSKAVKGGFAIGSFDESKKGPAVNFTSLTPQNYFIGHNSGSKTTTGLYNSFVGYEAGFDNTGGSRNVLLGFHAGRSNTTGENNVFIGNEGGLGNTTGTHNVFLGYQAGFSSNSSYNTFLGYQTGYNTTGSYNSFIGYQSGNSNISGTHNTYNGFQAGYSTNSSYNTALGYQAGVFSLSGSNNVFIGMQAGRGIDRKSVV